MDFSNQSYGQLFCLKDDPDEVVNLWDAPDAQDVKFKLRQVMLQWLLESNLKTGEWQAGWR